MLEDNLYSRKAWLMLTKEIRQHGGNLGYDDNAPEYYSWDSTVPSSTAPSVGDYIAIWDGETILGAGIIENIDVGSAQKVRLRCPSCNQVKIKSRFNTNPKYRCHNQSCKYEFEIPDEEYLEVTTFKSNHSASWYDLSGLLDAPTLRSLCVQPKSQQSIRPLDWPRFLAAIPLSLSHNFQNLDSKDIINAGHRDGKTRVRIGQSKFRKNLLEKFGNICAFSGPCHERALDAAHLYSFALTGVHEVKAGLLLRKDLHRLFDLGLITVNPISLTLQIAKSLHSIEQFKSLDGKKLSVPVGSKAIKWITDHWDEHHQHLNNI